MNSSNTRIGVWASILVCAALCAYSLSFRHRVESRNKAVEIVAEWDQIRQLSATSGTDPLTALTTLKQSGLTGIVASEQFVSEFPGLESLGYAAKMDLLDTKLTRRITSGISRLYPAFKNGAIVSEDLVKQVPIGVDPEASQAARQTGLSLTVRHGNPASSPKGYVRETLRLSAEAGAKYFLPLGDQVLGRRDQMSELYDSLEEFQMYYAAPEFAKIGGDLNVIGAHPERTVRLHAAQAAEIDKLTEAGVIERYAKGATERNIRILLVRSVTNSSQNPVQSFATLIGKLKKQMEKEGMTVRAARPFEVPNVPRWLFVAIGLALAPIAVFVVWDLTKSRRMTVASGFVFALLGAACWLDAGRGYAALLGATVLPLASLSLVSELKLPLVFRFLVLSAVSLVGGMIVAGLLNDLPYFVKADQFSGVKLAHFLPVSIAGIAVLMRSVDLKTILNSPIYWIQAVLGLVVLAGLAFMLSRTGNDNPAGVSGLELKFRELLENVLSVRPRTKEFMIGHPAMIVGLGLLMRAKSSPELSAKLGGWTALVVLVGMIGQTSLVNTLCHLHTPLAIGLTRILVGLIIGSIIGLFIWAIVSRELTRKTSS